MKPEMAWPYFDPEYENLSIRINPPRVSVDNTTCNDCTLIKVDSMNKPGILLEVVQILTDLDLTISKAYISSDGGWFMDVFHVTDQQGNKITDRKTIDYIEKALGPKRKGMDVMTSLPGKMVGVHSVGDHMAIELIATDRPGLLSEIFAILANLHFNVVAAEIWTHNRRIACVVYVNDDTKSALHEPERLSIMEEQLKNILGENDEKSARTSFNMGLTHVDRRLHQMFFADRDYEGGGSTEVDPLPVRISVEHCREKGYSVVTVQSKDRPKLMFDIVCTLTDMQFVVFHATISSDGPRASQEYYIRHIDGCTLDTEGEKERVIKCLEAAIKRRVSEGVSLELCAKDRINMPISYSSGSSSGNSWLDPEFQELADHVDNETIAMWHPNLEVHKSRSIAKKWREKNNNLLEDIMYLQTRVKVLQGMNNTLGAEVSDLSNINKELSMELEHARTARESFAKAAANNGKTSHLLLIYGIAVSIAMLISAMCHA